MKENWAAAAQEFAGKLQEPPKLEVSENTALIILQAFDAAFSEGQLSDGSEKIITWIVMQYPQFQERFSHLPWKDEYNMVY